MAKRCSCKRESRFAPPKRAPSVPQHTNRARCQPSDMLFPAKRGVSPPRCCSRPDYGVFSKSPSRWAHAAPLAFEQTPRCHQAKNDPNLPYLRRFAIPPSLPLLLHLSGSLNHRNSASQRREIRGPETLPTDQRTPHNRQFRKLPYSSRLWFFRNSPVAEIPQTHRTI